MLKARRAIASMALRKLRDLVLLALAWTLQAIRQCLAERRLALGIDAGEPTMDAVVARLRLRGWRTASIAGGHILTHLLRCHASHVH